MSEPYKEMQERKWRVAEAARAAFIAHIGVELMNAFNRGKTDPSVMAVCGHDTSTGYEFVIERDGRRLIVTVTQEDLGRE